MRLVAHRGRPRRHRGRGGALTEECPRRIGAATFGGGAGGRPGTRSGPRHVTHRRPGPQRFLLRLRRSMSPAHDHRRISGRDKCSSAFDQPPPARHVVTRCRTDSARGAGSGAGTRRISAERLRHGGQEKVGGPLHQAQRSHVRRRQGVQAGRRRSHRRRPARAWIGNPRLTRVAGAGVLRRLEPKAGAPRFKGGRHVWSTNDAMARLTRARRTAVTRAHHRRSHRTPDGRQHHLSFHPSREAIARQRSTARSQAGERASAGGATAVAAPVRGMETRAQCGRLRDGSGVVARAQLWSVVRAVSATSTAAAQLPSRLSASSEREPGSAA